MDFFAIAARSQPGRWLKSLPAILFRVANPVEPFGFKVVQNHLLLALPREISDGLGQQANQCEPLTAPQPNVFEQLHKDFLPPTGRRINCR